MNRWKTLLTSLEKNRSTTLPTFVIWTFPNSFREHWGPFPAHNGVDSSSDRPLSFCLIWNVKTFCLAITVVFRRQSPYNALGCVVLTRRTKPCKRPCSYYSNSSATFHCLLVDLVFKLNPGPTETITNFSLTSLGIINMIT